MSALVIQESVRIPAEVADLESFRRWVRSNSFPERGRFSLLGQELWVDMSPEDLFSHNQVTGELAFAITGLLKRERLGRYFHDRVLLTNAAAGLSTEPDGTFASWECLKTKRVRLVKGVEGFVEVEGTPDMTLEVVSPSSVKKDTVVLRGLYWRAGIDEYWLVDVRGKRLRFDILRRGRRGYTPARKRSGWVKSAVFGKSFRLTRGTDELGYPEYTLLVR